jgi:hypothetical protein
VLAGEIDLGEREGVAEKKMEENGTKKVEEGG